MESTTLNELKETFEAKISGLTRCMDLSSAVLTPDGLDEQCKHQLASIHRELCIVESLVGQMKTLVASGKQQLQCAKLLKDTMEEQARHIHHIQNHIPERLPGKELLKASSHTNNGNQRRPPLTSVQDNKNNQDSSSSQKSSSKGRSVVEDSKRKKAVVPRMELVTVEEFQGVPKYMKGRLNYDDVNTAVDIINSAISARYMLLQKPRKTLGETAMKKVRRLREQENKETKGVFFFTEEDYKASSNGHCATTSRSIFTILRHCGRLREIRSAGLTRYALIR